MASTFINPSNLINSESLSKIRPDLVEKIKKTVYLLTNKQVTSFAEMMVPDHFNPVMIFIFSDGTKETIEINKFMDQYIPNHESEYNRMKDQLSHNLPYIDRKVREIAGDI
jgi:uncharacterized protein (DUF305 family)